MLTWCQDFSISSATTFQGPGSSSELPKSKLDSWLPVETMHVKMQDVKMQDICVEAAVHKDMRKGVRKGLGLPCLGGHRSQGLFSAQQSSFPCCAVGSPSRGAGGDPQG